MPPGKVVKTFQGSLVPGLAVQPMVAVTDGQLDLTKTVASRASTRAYHSTLFEDFRLRAQGFYNFFTEDEATNPAQDPNVHPRDLARHVELRWRTVPLREILISSPKRLRPLDDRVRGVRPALPISEAIGSVANGYVGPGAISALLVNPLAPPGRPRFDEDQFLLDDSAGGCDAASQRTADDGQFALPTLPFDSVRARVNFVDPSIAGAVHDNRVAVSRDEIHLTLLGSLSKLLPGFEVLSEFNQDVPSQNPPPKFPVSADAPTLVYVGYVIERHDVGTDGRLTLARTFYVDDLTCRLLVDREVVYGGRYAYRMRTVVQWTHPPQVGFLGDSTLDRAIPFDPAGGTPRKDASFYAGDWSDWSRAEVTDDVLPDPPDELTVRPVSHRGEVDVVWKMPNDPQRDVDRVRLVRCIEQAGRLENWVTLGDFPALNGRYVDRDVAPLIDSGRTYVYAMYSVSRHGEVSVLSEQLGVRLVGRSRYARELPVRQFGPRGSDPMGAPGADRKGPRDWNMVARNRVGLYIRPSRSRHPLFDRTYVVEVQSLSTGERVQVILAVDSTDVNVGTVAGGRRA